MKIVKNPKVWAPDKVEEIRHLYWDEGLSSSEIVTRLELAIRPCYISSILRSRGIPVRTSSEAAKLAHVRFRRNIIEGYKKRNEGYKWTSDLVNKVRYMYWDLRMGTNDIAKELGTTPSIIVSGMKRHSVPLRTHSEAEKVAHERHPESYSMEAAPTWKGGRKVTRAGYVMVLLRKSDPFLCMAQGSRYVPEHRYVMAKHLGRPLEIWEIVHHKNHNKQDNRIENLHLYPSEYLHKSDHVEWKLISTVKRLQEKVLLLEAENTLLHSRIDEIQRRISQEEVRHGKL